MEENKPKSRTYLIVGVVVLILLCLCCAAAVLLWGCGDLITGAASSCSFSLQ